MKPAWTFELVRDTNAPMEKVVEVLSDGASFHRWHPRLRSIEGRILKRENEQFEMDYVVRACPGVEESGSFELRQKGARLLLIHRARFRGWPVLLLMGWWRVRSHRIWERLVRSL
jgi:hypothetical protein